MTEPTCRMVDDPTREDAAGYGSELRRPTYCTRCGRRGDRPVRTLATSSEEWSETMDAWNAAPEQTCEGRAAVEARDAAHVEAVHRTYFGLPPGYRIRPAADRLADEAEAQRLHRR